MRTKVDVKMKIGALGFLPEYAHAGDSGFDIRAKEDFTVLAGQTAIIGTDLFPELPEGYEIQVRPRSGMAAKNGITVLNTPGTVDESYRGEIKVILYNSSQKNFAVTKGDRIAQGVLSPTFQAVFQQVEELTDTDRGEGGLGHTGTK